MDDPISNKGRKGKKPAAWAAQKLADYPVGYCRPPAHTQFAPGESGNRRGRPKGSASVTISREISILTEVILDEAQRPIVISENGQKLTMTALQLVARKLFSNAMKGSVASSKAILDVLRYVERVNQKQHEKAMESAMDYKLGAEVFVRRFEANPTPENLAAIPLPHPDDIQIDLRRGEIRVTGPQNIEELKELEMHWANFYGLEAAVDLVRSRLATERRRDARIELEMMLAKLKHDFHQLAGILLDKDVGHSAEDLKGDDG